MPTIIHKAKTRWKQFEEQHRTVVKFTKWFVGIATPVATAFFTGLLKWIADWVNRTLFLGTIIIAPTDPTVASRIEENCVLISVSNVNGSFDTLIHHDTRVSLARGTYKLALADNRSSKAVPLAPTLFKFLSNGSQINNIQIEAFKTHQLKLDYRPAGFLKVDVAGDPGQRQIRLRLSAPPTDSSVVDTTIPPVVLMLSKGTFTLKLLVGEEPFAIASNVVVITPHDTTCLKVPFVTIQGRVTRGSDIETHMFNSFVIKVENRQSAIEEDGGFYFEGLPPQKCYRYEILTVDGKHHKSGRIFNIDQKTTVTIGQGENITI